ncbi:hypothetical protein [Moorena producens]|uniref:hypothetical protein n=1 Tax=Moorena producens TaxID=1155739 RepID=UPI003C760938
MGSPAEHFDFSRRVSVGESDSAGIPAHPILDSENLITITHFRDRISRLPQTLPFLPDSDSRFPNYSGINAAANSGNNST